jgi:hypothetical protein
MSVCLPAGIADISRDITHVADGHAPSRLAKKFAGL